MVDRITKARRSEIMSNVRAKNTEPELLIRSALFKLGFRYRIHSKKLPGCPDIVLPKYRAVIFVHGCFWHGHACRAGKLPSTNTEFWKLKISKNQERDRIISHKLNALGWKILYVWECSLKGSQRKLFDLLVLKITHWIKKEESNKDIQIN